MQRRRLARVAQSIRQDRRHPLPPLVLFSDEERMPNPIAAMRALPAGSSILVRARKPKHRCELARAAKGLATKLDIAVFIADDPAMARRLGLALHVPEKHFYQLAHWRATTALPVTASAHSLGAACRALALGARAVFLSPVFPTASHPYGPHLGAVRARLMARQIPGPVYALGGVTGEKASLLSGFAGLAAIGGLIP